VRNILLLVHDDAGQEARLQAALDIVRALNGHLTCLDVTVMPEIRGVGMLLSEERRRESENRRNVEKRLAREGVSWDWIDTTGFLEPMIEKAARMADLFVVSRKLGGIQVHDMRALAAGLIVASGKPILAVPEDSQRLAVTGSALVAWDGSLPAIAALQAGVPLLQLASVVSLIEIDDGSIETPAEEAATYLSRHDVEAMIIRISPDGRSAAEVILAQISEREVDYVVMGGFGHSRFVEALFGGVTRKLLTSSPVPLFLAR
jgi:nucleotide-binding universal stress UspA family protein